MQLRNLTPHAIALLRDDGSTRILEAERPAARIATADGRMVDRADGVPVYGPSIFKHVEGLPAPRPDTLIVVSQLTALLVAATAPDRDDVVYPATGLAAGAKRDKTGTIAVRRLIRACGPAS